MEGRARRIPSLDGLRAISIVMVVFSHLHLALPKVLGEWLNVAELGVRVFFVISGFLITSLLIEEVKRTGTVSLRGFYLRRVFRIFPAFYAYVGVILLLEAFGLLHLRPGDAVAAMTYSTNYHHDRAWHLGHMWSLSVEEQFYLMWPALLLFVGVRRGLIFAAGCLLAAPAIRVATWVLFPAQRVGIGESFQTVFDAIAVGCLLAGLREQLGRRAAYLAFLRSPAFLLVPALAFTCNAFQTHTRFMLPVGETIVNVAAALCIDRWVRFPDGAFGRLLNTRPFIFVGGLSYSLYLWQQLFMGHDGWVVQRFPLKVLCAFAAAVASYYLVEQPFLRMRARLSARAAAARKAREPAPAGRQWGPAVPAAARAESEPAPPGPTVGAS